MPEFYRDEIKLIPNPIDFDVFDYLQYVKENIITFVSEGNNLLIRGACGNGKTTWATKILKQYLMNKSAGNGFVSQAFFISLSNYLTQLKHNISAKSEDFLNFQEALYDIPLLVIDDLGTSSLQNDHIHETIYDLINYRNNSKLSTIYTTNLDDEDLYKNLGERLASRVINSSTNCTIKSEIDFRRPQTKNFSYTDFVKSKENNNGKKQ